MLFPIYRRGTLRTNQRFILTYSRAFFDHRTFHNPFYTAEVLEPVEEPPKITSLDLVAVTTATTLAASTLYEQKDEVFKKQTLLDQLPPIPWKTSLPPTKIFQELKKDTSTANIDNSLVLERFQSMISKFEAEKAYFEALSLVKAGDYDCRVVFKLFQDAAKVGHVDAAFNAGLCYDPNGSFSDFMPPDIARATVLYKQAAHEGHVRAQFRLGMLLLRDVSGLTISKFQDAVKWLQMAAERGYGEASRVLSLLTPAL